MVPFVPSNLLWGLTYGVAAHAAGMSTSDATLISASVWSATVQFAALQSVDAAFWVLLGSSFLLSLRFVPMLIVTAPRVEAAGVTRALLCCGIADASFAMLARRAGRVSAPYLLGTWFALYTTWVAGTWIGASAASAVVADLRIVADAVTAAVFIFLAAGLVRSRYDALAAGVACVVSIALSPYVPSGVSVLCAGTAGMLAVTAGRRMRA